MHTALRLLGHRLLLVLAVVSAQLACARLAFGFDVSVSGYLERGDLQRQYGGWLAFSVPLERFWTSEASVPTAGRELDASLDGFEEVANLVPLLDSSPEQEPRELLADPSFDAGEPGRERMELQQLAEPDPDATPVPTPLPAEDGARRPVRDAAATVPEPERVTATAEPSWRLSSAQLRGLAAAVAAEDVRRLARVTSLSDRARTSAWLPELRFRAGRNSDQTLRLTPTIEEPDRWALSGGSGVRLEGELHWRFDRLVFASEEVAIERVRLLLEQQRRRAIVDVLEWVFRWQVAVARSAEPELGAADRLEAQLSVEQAAGMLDVLSGGWFSAHVTRPSTPASER